MTEEVYDSHHGLILQLRTKDYNQEKNLNFNHDALQEMRFKFLKSTF